MRFILSAHRETTEELRVRDGPGDGNGQLSAIRREPCSAYVDRRSIVRLHHHHHHHYPRLHLTIISSTALPPSFRERRPTSTDHVGHHCYYYRPQVVVTLRASEGISCCYHALIYCPSVAL